MSKVFHSWLVRQDLSPGLSAPGSMPICSPIKGSLDSEVQFSFHPPSLPSRTSGRSFLPALAQRLPSALWLPSRLSLIQMWGRRACPSSRADPADHPSSWKPSLQFSYTCPFFILFFLCPLPLLQSSAPVSPGPMQLLHPQDSGHGSQHRSKQRALLFPVLSK